MFCIICGMKIRPESQFCERCEKMYYSSSSAQTQAPEQDPPKNSSSTASQSASQNKSQYASQNKSQYASQNKSQYASQNKSQYASQNKSQYASQNASSSSTKPISLDQTIEIAMRYLEAEDYNNTLTILQYAQTHYPNSSGVYNLMGLSYRRLGNNKSAIEYYKKAASLEPDNGTILMNIGIALTLDEKPQESMPWFEKALELLIKNRNNNYPIALGNYSIALAKSGYPDKAVYCLNEAERLGYRNANTIRDIFKSLGIRYE